MGRKLCELKVLELKQELEKRGLRTTGGKNVLKSNLEDALKAEGEDPVTFEFDDLPERSEQTKVDAEFLGIILEKLEEQQACLEGKLIEQFEKQHGSLESKMKLLVDSSEELKTSLEEKLEKQQNSLSEKLQEQKNSLHDKIAEVDIKITESKKRILKLEEEMEKVKISPGEVIREEVSSRKGMKPPVFDGQTPWPIYKKQFEAAARANNWNKEDKTISLVLALRGSAAELLQTIPADKQSDYESLARAIEMRYGDEHMQQVYRMQLRTKTQKAGETLQQMQADVERLVHLSYVNQNEEFLNEVATEAFINAIADKEIQQALRLAGKKTIAEALAYALAYETVRQATRYTPRVREVSMIECSCQRVQQTQNSRALRCWNCNQLGHLQRDCRKPRRRGATNITCPECTIRARGNRERDMTGDAQSSVSSATQTGNAQKPTLWGRSWLVELMAPEISLKFYNSKEIIKA